jgi:hemerythrin superfamily protein
MKTSHASESRRRKSRGASRDAIALLKSDHRQVSGWFAQFKKTRSTGRKQGLVEKICHALKVHTRIEEEIFYPAFLVATRDKDKHHEAEVEHAAAKRLIAEIEAMNPEDDYFEAKVTVLSEMIKHHVKEEEKPGGLFAEARRSHMDLDDLGNRLRARKEQLVSDANAWGQRDTSVNILAA